VEGDYGWTRTRLTLVLFWTAFLMIIDYIRAIRRYSHHKIHVVNHQNSFNNIYIILWGVYFTYMYLYKYYNCYWVNLTDAGVKSNLVCLLNQYTSITIHLHHHSNFGYILIIVIQRSFPITVIYLLLVFNIYNNIKLGPHDDRTLNNSQLSYMHDSARVAFSIVR
jgi:hypothetical protein